MKRFIACVIALFAVSHAYASADTGIDIANDDIPVVAADIQHTFNEFLVTMTGVIDWNKVDGLPGSAVNTNRLNELHNITPLAMVEGTAYDLTKYMGTTAYTGLLEVSSSDRAGCIVGALVQGFDTLHEIVPKPTERAALLKLAGAQFGNGSAALDSFKSGLDTGLIACGIKPPIRSV